MSRVKPGVTVFYELVYHPGKSGPARYAIDLNGNRYMVSAAAISKAKKAGKDIHKVVAIPPEFEFRFISTR